MAANLSGAIFDEIKVGMLTDTGSSSVAADTHSSTTPNGFISTNEIDHNVITDAANDPVEDSRGNN